MHEDQLLVHRSNILELAHQVRNRNIWSITLI